MHEPDFFHRKSTYLVGIPVLLVLVLVGGPFVYINFIEGDPPARLTLDSGTSPTRAAGGTAAAPVTVDGTWKVAKGSQAGYRVDENLFGQNTQAVGRTSAITGGLAITGTTVASASFTVDLTQVTSDQGSRDRQFQGRIMDTGQFPDATFRMTQPISLGATVPADGRTVTATATGGLTLHGRTQPVTFGVKARRSGARIAVNGTIPVHFADYGISNPSFGPANVGDDGEVEFLLELTKTA